MMQTVEVRARLAQAKGKHGELARIARESGVTYRTLYNILGAKREPTIDTIKKLSRQFGKDDRRSKAQ